MNKICIKCHKEKSIDSFSFNKNRRDGRSPYCRICKSIIDKKWRKANSQFALKCAEWTKNNPEKVKAIKRRYYEANKEKTKSAAYRWIIENPEKRRLIVNAGMVKRRKKIMGNLNHRMSVRINELIRKNKNRKCWKAMVDYTLDELKQHLEKQFLPGMSWDNRYLWHIDHIIPISAFTFKKPEDEDFKRCWALENLQPLWAVDNIKKSNKFEKHFQPKLIFNYFDTEENRLKEGGY